MVQNNVNTKSRLAQKLYQLRTKLGVNTVEAASNLNVTPTTILMWEDDKYLPSPENLHAIARYYAKDKHEAVIKELARLYVMANKIDRKKNPLGFALAWLRMVKGVNQNVAADDLR